MSPLPATPFPLPELVVKPSRAQLFMFSAATWNRHHVHYDPHAARAEGHADVVVHRALLGNFIARQLTQWLAGRGAISSLSWKVQSSAVPNRDLRCLASVIRVEPGPPLLAHCEVSIVNEEGTTVCTGAATLTLNPKAFS